VIPDQPLTVRRPLVDADDAISRLLEERYDLPTPNRIGEIVAVAIYNNYRRPTSRSRS